MDLPTNDQLIGQLAAGSGTLGAKIVELGTAMADADVASQVNHLKNFIQPILKTPNVVQDQVESLPKPFDALTRHSELPAICALNGERFSFQEANFNFDMSVSSHTEETAKTDVSVGSTTEISGGWLFARAKQTIRVDVSHSNSQTRSTDMTARMSMNLKMGREAIPEGLAKMIDTANEFSRVANEIRLKVATAKLNALQKQIEEDGVTPEMQELPPANEGDQPAA